MAWTPANQVVAELSPAAERLAKTFYDLFCAREGYHCGWRDLHPSKRATYVTVMLDMLARGDIELGPDVLDETPAG